MRKRNYENSLSFLKLFYLFICGTAYHNFCVLISRVRIRHRSSANKKVGCNKLYCGMPACMITIASTEEAQRSNDDDVVYST